jgi:hypothetical protein
MRPKENPLPVELRATAGELATFVADGLARAKKLSERLDVLTRTPTDPRYQTRIKEAQAAKRIYDAFSTAAWSLTPAMVVAMLQREVPNAD